MGKAVIFLFVLFFLFLSCEGYLEGNGYVFDELTRQPIDSVRVAHDRGKSVAYSDSTGHFEIGAFVGCVGCDGCGDITAQFSADGYEDASLENPKGDTIFMKPQ